MTKRLMFTAASALCLAVATLSGPVRAQQHGYTAAEID